MPDKDNRVLVDKEGKAIPNVVSDSQGNLFPNIATDIDGEALRDKQGNLVINIIRDNHGSPITNTEGTPIPNILFDTNNEPILDTNGNVLPNVLRDKDGLVIIDDNGQTIPNVQRDAKGAPLIDRNDMFIPNVKVDPKTSNPVIDELGNSIARVILNAAGNPFLDKKGNATDLDGKCIPIVSEPKPVPPPKIVENLPLEEYKGEIPREEEDNRNKNICVLSLPADVFVNPNSSNEGNIQRDSKNDSQPNFLEENPSQVSPIFFESQLPEPAKPLNERDPTVFFLNNLYSP